MSVSNLCLHSPFRQTCGNSPLQNDLKTMSNNWSETRGGVIVDVFLQYTSQCDTSKGIHVCMNNTFTNHPIIFNSYTYTLAAFVEDAENNRHRRRFIKVSILIGLLMWEDLNVRHTMAAFHRSLRRCVWQQGWDWWWCCQRSEGMKSEWYCVTPSGSRSCWVSIHSLTKQQTKHLRHMLL